MPKPTRSWMQTSSTRWRKPDLDNFFTSTFNGIFFNRAFDKSRLKGLVKWTLSSFGENKTITLVENLKGVGYSSATEAGLSLGIDDLLIPPSKISHIVDTETKLEHTQRRVSKGYLTSVEYLSQVITTWNVTNDVIKNEVIAHFRSKDILNPVYMMAFSGARGNISQVRQLVGMRGLMSDPSGRIIDYAIQSNFREGLTLTEYVISCYGARKGVVDTALRTATSGYLTRRLVDVAQHVVIRRKDCATNRGIYLTSLENEDKVYMTGPFRLTGRVLAEDVYDHRGSKLLAKRNQEVTPNVATLLFQHHTKILVRSPLTCQDKRFICQLCYGWNLSKGRLVSIGETVGIIAAQSIGEPGTQLTMRTFHTGGVFSGEISKTFQAPVYGKIFFLNSIPGKCVRTDQGEVAFLTKQSGTIYLQHLKEIDKQRITKIFLKPYTLLFVKQGEIVYPNQTLAEPSSLERLSDKQLSFQTIFAPLSGEVKFRTASISKGAHNPGYTTFAPLNQSSSEFWILSAHIQSFKKFMAPFIKPGDQVEFRSPVFFYGLVAKTYTPIFDSFAFQQYVSFYRLQTLFLVFQTPAKTFLPQNQKALHGVNVSNQTAVWFSPSLMERGTVIERVLPFISFLPKYRLSFSWAVNQFKSSQQKEKKNFFKALVQNKSQSKRKTSFLSQKAYPLKPKNENKKICHFRRFLTFYSQPWQQMISKNYPFAVNQKTPIAFLISLCPFLSQTFFSSSKPIRNNETKQFSLFLSWLTLFEKHLFLSSSVLPSDSDLVFFQPYKKRFCLKKLDLFEYKDLKQIELESLSYCPRENLWSIAYLKPPTYDFKLPFSNLFPQELTWNLSSELKHEPRNSQILKNHFAFCLYSRLTMHFRFQQSYKVLFSKTLRAQPSFEPVVFGRKEWEEWELKPPLKRKVTLFPKSPPFLDRIHQNIQSKTFFLFLNQKQEKSQPVFFEPTENLDEQRYDGPSEHLTAKQNSSNFPLKQKKKVLKFSNRQYLPTNFINHFNKIFTFHEFVQLPFCFETFSTKLTQLMPKPIVEKPIHDRKKDIQNTFSGFSFLSNTMHQFQIQMLLKENAAKKTTRPKNGFFQAEVLLYVLITKAKISWVSSKKFVNSLLLLMVTFSKTLVWKQVIQKQNQLLNLSLVKSSTPSNTKEKYVGIQKNSDPSVSMYYFLKKEFSKKATVRVQPVQIWKTFIVSSVFKRAWFSIPKRRQIARARLNIVYRLTFLLTPVLSSAFQWFTCPLFPTTQQLSSGIFEPLFDFHFGLFETRYYKGWNPISKNQSQNQSDQQVIFKKWFQSLSVFREQKIKRRQTKRKLAFQFKGIKSKVRALILLWFYDGRKKRSRVPINKRSIPFSAYQSIDLSYQTRNCPHAQLFLQKNYENQFLTKFKIFSTKLRNVSMLFLIAGSTGFVNPSTFRGNLSTSLKFLQSFSVSVQNTRLTDETQSNQMFLSLLKQMKKDWLQKQLNHKKVSKPKKATKIPTIAKPRKTTQTKTKTTKVTAKITNVKAKTTNKTTKPNKMQIRQMSKTLKPLKTKQTVQKVKKSESDQKVTARLLSTSSLSTFFQQQIGFNKYNHLNPFGWVSFVNSSNKSDLSAGSNQMESLKTEPKRQTFFAFFQNKFRAFYDPWWRHQMHQTHISASIQFLQNQEPLKKTVSIKHFMKHPNDFFASYLENNFFNKIMSHKKNISLLKPVFIDELSFYTQAIQLKVKKEARFSSQHPSRGLNVETVNNYVRFAFLKTAKLPLIVATKNPIGLRLGLQKRFLLFKQQQIFVSKTGRYRPALVFGAVKYKKPTKKSMKIKVELVTKSPYFLSMLQKGVVYRTGDAMAKTFGQTDFRYLNPVSLSGIKPPIGFANKNQQKIPAFNLSTVFHTSKLTSFQATVLQSHFKPISRWLMLYKSQFKATHLYISQQFNTSGPTLAYQAKGIQIRHFGYPNIFAHLSQAIQVEKPAMSEKFLDNERVKKMTVNSPVAGFVLQCYDGEARSKDAPLYEHDMRRFRDQPEKTCQIAYLTDRDMTTYLLSLPLQKLGSFIPYGTMIKDHLLNQPGQVISVTKTKFILRRAQCFYLAAGSECSLNSGDLVSFGAPLVNVAYSQIQADDIIQGIPKIDQLFEARTRFGFLNLKQLLSKQYNFLRKKGSHTKREAILESIDFIQKKIVDGVQTVYQSQGVTICDKHVEIIVKQMTSKVRVYTSINFGFFKGDVVSLRHVEGFGLLDEDEFFECEPILLGITQAALQAEGFLSAASFQETVRVLSQATVVRKVDYLKHLKENIIIGHLLPTGTGLFKHFEEEEI